MRFTDKTVFAAAAMATLQQLLAGTSVFSGSAVLEQATRATLSKNGSSEARFASSSASAVLDWSKLDVPQGKTLGFDGGGTTFFNLVAASAGKSQIDGIVNGSGSVWVINPSGVAFGANSVVNVGGLFGVAAGNLSNESAIRDGSALVPSFSSFSGRVDVDGGAKFTADQVALLGKGVSVAGDFTGTKQLTVGGAGKMVVDEVEGGRISISVSDFAEDPTETGVSLGDLSVGDAVAGASGDLSAVSDRGVEVTGNVSVHGNVDIRNREGTIHVAQNARIASTSDSMPDINLFSAADDDVGGQGDIVIDGALSAEALWGFGAVNVVSGYGSKSSGSVYLNGSVGADYYSQLSARNGDVVVNGQMSSDVELSLSTYNGNVRVGKDAEVHAKGTYSDWGLNSVIRVYSAYETGRQGDVKIDGTVLAEGTDADLEMVAGYGMESAGTLSVAGSIYSAGTLKLTAGNGYSSAACNLLLDGGSITAKGLLQLNAIDGRVRLGEGSLVSSGGDVMIDSFLGVTGVGAIDARFGDFDVNGGMGNIDLDGRVQAKNANLSTARYIDYGYLGSIFMDNPENFMSGAVGAIGYDVNLAASGGLTLGTVMSFGQLSVSAGGSIKQAEGTSINNSWTESGATFASKTGDVLLGNTGNNFSGLSVSGQNVAVSEQGGLTLGDSEVGGDLWIDSTGSVLQEEGTSLSCAGRATIKSTGGDVILGSFENKIGGVSAEGKNVLVFVENGTEVGDVTAREGDATIYSRANDIVVAEGATVESRTGQVRLWTAGEIGTKGDVTILGDVKANGAEGTVTVNAGMLEGASGSVRVSGKVEAAVSAALISRDGDVVVEKTGRLAATAEDGRAYIWEESSSGGDGSVVVKGVVEATGKGGAVYVAQKGDGTGHVSVEGQVTADDLVGVLAAGGGVTIGKTARLTTTGQDSRIHLASARNETEIGDVVVNGDLSSSSVYVSTSRGDVRVDGKTTGMKNVTMVAVKGGVTIGSEAEVSATGEDGGCMTKK